MPPAAKSSRRQDVQCVTAQTEAFCFFPQTKTLLSSRVDRYHEIE